MKAAFFRFRAFSALLLLDFLSLAGDLSSTSPNMVAEEVRWSEGNETRMLLLYP